MKSGLRALAREAAIRGALVLLGLAAALPLSELVVRLAGVAPDVVIIQAGRFRLSKNPKIGYVPLAEADDHGNPLDLSGERGEVNSLGYRDSEHTVGKPEGAYRIVVLGDSLGVGLYVERREDTFPVLLEDLLRREGIPAEVINLSVAGYNTQQEVETLRDRGLQYRPDLVVLAYCLNDRAPNDGGIMKTLLDKEMESDDIPRARVRHPWLIRSALYRFLRHEVFSKGTRRTPEHRNARLEEVSLDTTEEYLHELEWMARANGFQVLVVVFPELTDLTAYRYDGEHRRVARLSRECGFEHLDLLRTFRFCEAMADGEIGYDRYHPTPPGHLCAAGAIADYIRERILETPPTTHDGGRAPASTFPPGGTPPSDRSWPGLYPLTGETSSCTRLAGGQAAFLG